MPPNARFCKVRNTYGKWRAKGMLWTRTPFPWLALLLAASLNAQPANNGNNGSASNTSASGGSASSTSASDDDSERILGVIPNYQTVNDPTPATPPLTPLQKWTLAARESSDPFTIVAAGLGASISQAHNGDPKYGSHGASAFSQRFGAALADETSQNLFSDALLATWLHQDPRYFRKGPGSRVLTRVGYALSRPFVTRMDSGGPSVNWSSLVGTSMGIALSNAYYPPPSVTAGESAMRLISSLGGAALGNLLPEFWPDIRRKFSHRPAPAAVTGH